MLLFASDLNRLAPVVIILSLDAVFFLLFLAALFMGGTRATKKAGRALLRFLTWAGLALLIFALGTHIPMCFAEGSAHPLVLLAPTVLLVAVVGGTWREVRSRTTDQPVTEKPGRSRAPEDW